MVTVWNVDPGWLVIDARKLDDRSATKVVEALIGTKRTAAVDGKIHLGEVVTHGVMAIRSPRPLRLLHGDGSLSPPGGGQPIDTYTQCPKTNTQSRIKHIPHTCFVCYWLHLVFGE